MERTMGDSEFDPIGYHFIGIGGIGMSGLARLMLGQGESVSGSDMRQSAIIADLERCGARIIIGHSEENIPPHTPVVYTSDIPQDNVELVAARKKGVPLLHRSELLAHIAGKYRTFAVGGTHGKTTTTALLSTILCEAGWDPSYMVGGELKKGATNAYRGGGACFIMEADESDGTFLRYHPEGAILTNIDLDHMGYFETEKALVAAFRQFASQVSSSRFLLWCAEDERLCQLKLKGTSYGFRQGCDIQIVEWEQRGWSNILTLDVYGVRYSHVEVSLIGKHNALNASAAFGMGILLGIPEEDIRRACRSFQGVKRRCDKKGSVANVHFLDDYAHHPTEIQTTLEAIRRAIGQNQHLVAVFQPHRYTRTRDCLGNYGGIFQAADQVLLTEIYASGESPIAGISHEEVLADICSRPAPLCQHISRKELSRKLLSLVPADAWVVTLGAGDITRVYDETLADSLCTCP